MPDSIAGLSDAALIDVSTQTHNAMLANLANYPGVTQQQVNDLKTFYQNFEADLTDQIAKLAASRASTQTKDASRSIDEGQLRLLRNVTKAAGASDAAMAETGMPTGSSKAPSNATVPAGQRHEELTVGNGEVVDEDEHAALALRRDLSRREGLDEVDVTVGRQSQIFRSAAL